MTCNFFKKKKNLTEINNEVTEIKTYSPKVRNRSDNFPEHKAKRQTEEKFQIRIRDTKKFHFFFWKDFRKRK